MIFDLTAGICCFPNKIIMHWIKVGDPSLDSLPCFTACFNPLLTVFWNWQLILMYKIIMVQFFLNFCCNFTPWMSSVQVFSWNKKILKHYTHRNNILLLSNYVCLKLLSIIIIHFCNSTVTDTVFISSGVRIMTAKKFIWTDVHNENIQLKHGCHWGKWDTNLPTSAWLKQHKHRKFLCKQLLVRGFPHVTFCRSAT